MSNQLTLILGASTLATFHLQGCSDSDDNGGYTTSNDCNPNDDFTFTQAGQILALGNADSDESKELPNCGSCVASRLANGGDLNGNGYCAADGSTVSGYPACNRANAQSTITNGFPITRAINLGDLDTWPANINGVVEALLNCGADLDTSAIDTLLPQSVEGVNTCIGISTGTGVESSPILGLDPSRNCGLCIVSQLQANGCNASNDADTKDSCLPVPFNQFSFADTATWPDTAVLRRAVSGSSSADPGNTFPGCGATWEL